MDDRGAGLRAGPVPMAGKPVILVLGDSLSAEYGLKRGEGWVPLLEKRLAQQKIAATVVNASISGDTTSGGRSRAGFAAQAAPADPRGARAGRQRRAARPADLGTPRDNLTQMTKAAQAAGAKVLIVGMQVPPNYGGDYRKRFEAVFSEGGERRPRRRWCPSCCKRRGRWARRGESRCSRPTASTRRPRRSRDMLDNVWPELKKLLGR